MRINARPPTGWQDLQEQTARILSECGLTVEIEKTIPLARGTIEVDVYAVDTENTPQGVYVCECKDWKKRISKEKIHSFRTVVIDSGASCGFLISSEGFQSGARDAAQFSNVKLQTWDELEAFWQERWITKYMKPRLADIPEELMDYIDPLGSSRVKRMLVTLSDARRKEFLELHRDHRNRTAPILAMMISSDMVAEKIELPLIAYRQVPAPEMFPEGLLTTDSLREFVDLLCGWISEIHAKFTAVLNGD